MLILVLACPMLAIGCGGDDDESSDSITASESAESETTGTETPGEIVGISAQISMEEAQSDNIENLAFGGSVMVLLPDAGEVEATVDEALLPEIDDAPNFNVDEISGGFVASIVIAVDPPQDALLIQDESGNWEVTEILE